MPDSRLNGVRVMVCLVALASLCESRADDSPRVVRSSGRDIDRALAEMGLSRDDVGNRPEDWNFFSRSGPRTSLWQWVVASPLDSALLEPYFSKSLLVTKPSDCVRVMSRLSLWSGRSVRRGLIGDPLEHAKRLAAKDAPVLAAIQRVYALGRKPIEAKLSDDLSGALRPVPIALRRSLATLIHAMCDAHKWSEEACRIETPERWTRILQHESRSEAAGAVESSDSPLDDYRQLRATHSAVQRFEYNLPLIGAQEIVAAVAEFVSAVDAQDQRTPGWSLFAETPFGVISIGSEHARVDPSTAPFLLIDFSGDDTHGRVGANSPPWQRVSVAIDFGGDDTYAPPDADAPALGAGHCGVGMLFDLAGHDTYRVTRNGLGQGLFGVGLLFDGSGDDTYDAVEKAQGWAVAGAGVLADLSGDDAYTIYNAGQGFGGPLGVGLLTDGSGDDVYIANDTDLRFEASQSKQHNTSMAQGAGAGWRGDYLHGLSVPGGVGVLFDGAGNDRYSCGVFGQGAGYWFGTGILVDRAGDDDYRGQWYVQGASAHFAAGILLDQAGNDRYQATMNMSQGAGHDVGVGLLADAGGDDHYVAGTLSLGAGNASGVGLFIDRDGDDRYDVTRGVNNMGFVTPNREGSIRRRMAGVGLFMDLGGTDTYPVGRGGDGQQWAVDVTGRDTARGVDLSGRARTDGE
jgi:hypothetical protein